MTVADHPFIFEKAIIPWTKSKGQAKDSAANINAADVIVKSWALSTELNFTFVN